MKYWRDEDGTGPNLVVAWRDRKASKPVVAISSFHDNTTVEKNRRFGNAVRMPTVISDYNNSMNGCAVLISPFLTTVHSTGNRTSGGKNCFGG